MHPTDKAARIAGAVYLSMVITAPFSLIYVPSKLIVRGNATATADNILAHETMFRLSTFGELIGHVIFICLGIALYRLLRDVNKTWACAHGRLSFWSRPQSVSSTRSITSLR